MNCLLLEFRNQRINYKIMKKLKIILTLLTLTYSIGLFAQPGTLDLTFGNKGIVLTPIGTSEQIRAMAIQSDGKIIAAGYSGNGTNYDFAIVRYNADGTLDNSFSTDGKVTTAIGTSDDFIYAVAIQTDGKIVVAGSSKNTSTDYAVARYNSDGTLDNSFGSGGFLTTQIGTSTDVAYSLAIQSDGKIVVAGYSRNSTGAYDFSAARYNSDGSLDNNFSTDGVVMTDFSTNRDEGHSVAIQTDGKIIIGGWSSNSAGSLTSMGILRYNSNGTLDNTFSKDGLQTISFTVQSEIRAIKIQPDGKILLGGIYYPGTYNDFAIARIKTNGTLDSTFGSYGKLNNGVGVNVDDLNAIDLQSDGKIIVSGTAYVGSQWNFALARYTTGGRLDSSLNVKGTLYHFGNGTNNQAFAVKALPGGKILIAGYSQTGTDQDFALARFITNCINFIEIQPKNETVTAGKNVTFTLGGYSSSSFQWQKKQGSVWQDVTNTGQYKGATNDSLTISNTVIGDNNLNFRCVVKSGACVDTSKIVVLTVTPFVGIFQPSIVSASLVYPNPTDRNISIEYNLLREEIITIRLVDSYGKLIKTFTINEKQIAGRHKQVLELSENLVSGTYIINITSPNAQLNLKLVKK